MADNVPLSGNILGPSNITPGRTPKDAFQQGIWGDAGGNATDETLGNGVVGTSSFGTGVVGNGSEAGVYGRGRDQFSDGVLGYNDATDSTAVHGQALGNNGVAVLAEAFGQSGVGISSNIKGNAIKGLDVTLNTNSAQRGVEVTVNLGDEFVVGISPGNFIQTPLTANLATRLEAANFNNATTGTKVRLCPADAAGAAFFTGDVTVDGVLHKNGGGFRIDDPRDPENKYISHSFVESADMKNVYDGTAVLDANGEAVVTFPDWFDSINKDFRYQLTPIGAPAPNLHISQGIVGHCFAIAGGVSKLKVCWQVTGIRCDPWANANRILVEEEKPCKSELYGRITDR